MINMNNHRIIKPIETLDEFFKRKQQELQEMFDEGYDTALLEISKVLEDEASLEYLIENIKEYYNSLNESKSNNIFSRDYELQKSFKKGFEQALIEILNLIENDKSIEEIYEGIIYVLNEEQGHWEKEDDGRQYIKGDGSKGVFVRYKDDEEKGTLVASNPMVRRANKQWDRDNKEIQRKARIEQEKAFIARKNKRDEHWKKLEDAASPQDKIDIKIKRNIINSIFNEENYIENEKQLRKYGLTDKQIEKIEHGGFTLKSKIKNMRHFHVTPSGGKGSKSDCVVFYNMKNGKIIRIVKHDDYNKK